MGLRTWKRTGGCVVLAFAALGLLPVFAPPASAGEVEIHYAPAENLEHLDVGLLRSAHTKIDMAAYSLTDWPVIDALIDASRRGVAVRIVLDPGQQHAFDRLREIAGAIRMKAPGPYMHLKSYAIDGRILRSGSANFSASGLKQQDNDIVVVREPSAANAFEARFEQIWAGANPLPTPGNQFANPAPSPAPKTETAMPENCLIKGNVSRSGERIYHVPGDRAYARVRMDKGRDKRWFCTEEQAVAAGWRKASTW
ncbi:phospholipase D-like domain-containing protein [Methylocystis iwaonis]|uniref:phospholipase D-like domain-containing protein n=1 Tax=Methylocystis iwaonis TaxID=2885079 RepID=UPI00249118E4|nr:phospholipase D-like domain-containing protein [Methylocystis iwaonis]